MDQLEPNQPDQTQQPENLDPQKPNRKIWTIVFAVGSLTLLAFAAYSYWNGNFLTPDPQVIQNEKKSENSEASSQAVARKFYSGYLDCRNGLIKKDPRYSDYKNSDPLAYCVNRSEEVTGKFKQEMKNVTLEFDPITCSQDSPEKSEFDPAEVSGNLATVKVTDFYGESPREDKVTLNLKLESSWKVDSITCPIS